MGTRLLEFWEIRLVINQSVVPMDLESSPEDRSWSFHYLLSKVVFFVLSSLYIKHYLLILPLFVAICVIWLPRLTYGVYLVLFLKLGAIKRVIVSSSMSLRSSSSLDSFLDLPLFLDDELAWNATLFFFFLSSSSFLSFLSTPSFPHGMSLMPWHHLVLG